MPSDWRHSIVDLTNNDDDDSHDSDEGPLASLPIDMGPSNTQHIALPTGSILTNAPRPVPAMTRPAAAYPAFPQSTPQFAALPYTSPIASQHMHVGSTSLIDPSTSSDAAAMRHNGASNYMQVPKHAYAETSASESTQRAPKRMRMDAAGTSSTPSFPSVPMSAPGHTRPMMQQANTGPQSGASIPRPFRTLAPSDPTSWKPGTQGRPPSVQDLNRALKTNTRQAPVLGNSEISSPRTLHIDRGSPNSPSVPNRAGPGGYISGPVPLTTSYTQEGAPSSLQAPVGHGYTPYSIIQDAGRPAIAMSTTNMPVSAQAQPQNRPPLATDNASSRPSYFAGPAQQPREEDNDSVISDMSEPTESVPKPLKQTGDVTPYPSGVAPPTMSVNPQLTPGVKSRRRNGTCQFDMAQDHFLIFLKEVKQYKWSDITAEYNKYMPHRQYHSLQSRYSTLLNKRDRSQDPSTLILPPPFAAEADIDWANIHPHSAASRASKPVPQDIPHFNATHKPRARLEEQVPNRLTIQQAEHDYSSGADSAPRRERTRRAQRINYAWPKQRGATADDLDNMPKEAVQGYSSDEVFARSESPQEDAPLPSRAAAVENLPVDVSFDAEDAKVGLKLRKKGLRGTAKIVPYLSASQRSSMQQPTVVDWDQLSSRSWQNEVLHVDFSPDELKIVEEVVVSMKNISRSRHTLKRQLREDFKNLTEPKILQLVNELRRQLPCRDRRSIEAFVQDAMAGAVADQPQVKRLAAARPGLAMSSIEKPSTMSIIRERELGRHSRRGWQAASRPLTYQVKNKYMDSIGPAKCWTGASSDIHTLAWSPDGERFAAGAVAVDDPDSMQYNRSNNLLFGDMTHGTIHELAEHYKKRQRTESGANSTHAMFASQDPKLYTTVSAVAFSTTGSFMYSAGYDEHIGIWHADTETVQQPILVAKLNVRAQIDILSVNRMYEGILATAARSVDEKAIRLLRIDSEEPSQFDKSSFHSNKAVSRADLRILPTALQFEPKYGNLLLAGFGANTRESAFDMTGDLCLWDIETRSALHIHGSNKNVFDVEFNPNRTHMPLFAVGCVAGASVNRGTRSLIRLYDLSGPNKFTCPLEFECKALDMNDVVWCPHDEHLIAAGCTDGRAYIWDTRWPDDPLRVLSHGQSLMPLQEGVKHEITDTGVRFLSWGENATRLYSGSSDGVVKVWDVTRAEENTFIKDLITTDSGIMSGAFSADYSKLLVGEVNGSINVLEVGRDDVSLKETERLRYMPYEDDEQDEIQDAADITRPVPDSGIAEANHLLDSKQLQLVSMGNLPIRQAIQGPNYIGPFDQSSDAPFLRAQAHIFQQSLVVPPGPQCNIPACIDNPSTVTSEEIGDSGRSLDRVPDELRRQWKTDVSILRLVPGKARCTSCGRPARPLPGDDVDSGTEGRVVCERCSFSCFRCAATNAVEPATTTLICETCGGVWDIGVLGYECILEPDRSIATVQNVPGLRRWGREAYEEYLEEGETGYGDEENALSEWFLGLGI